MKQFFKLKIFVLIGFLQFMTFFASSQAIKKKPQPCPRVKCIKIKWNYAKTNGVRDYRINYASFKRLRNHGISAEEVKQAVILAADTWNEQANAAYFRLVGNSNAESKDHRNCFLDCCKKKGINYSLIVVADDSGSKINYSMAGPRCWTQKPNGKPGHPTQFIVILTNQPGYKKYFIAQKNMSPKKYDLVKGVMHELGHTLGLKGHEKGKWATMSGGNTGINHSRDLWQRDIECTHCISGNRFVKVFSSIQDKHGRFSKPRVLERSASKASTGAIYGNNNRLKGFNATFRRPIWQEAFTCFWQKNQAKAFLLGKPGSLAIEPLVSIGIREVVFRERPGVQRIFYSDYKDRPVSYALNGCHQVFTTWFNSNSKGPLISAKTGGMYYCRDNKCHHRTPLYSAKPVAVTWDNGNKKTIFSWVNQNRKSNEHSREVLVSVGYIKNTLLSKPESLGIKSNVGPGLACKDGSPGRYNCILAYVDADRADGLVRIRRFRARKIREKYILEIDPNTYNTGKKTGSSIAAWYNNGTGKFYIAIREADYGQYLLVCSSASGRRWKKERNLGYSIIGPTAVSYEQGNKNNLVWLGY